MPRVLTEEAPDVRIAVSGAVVAETCLAVELTGCIAEGIDDRPRRACCVTE